VGDGRDQEFVPPNGPYSWIVALVGRFSSLFPMDVYLYFLFLAAVRWFFLSLILVYFGPSYLLNITMHGSPARSRVKGSKLALDNLILI
jgi:hypothetical protein